MPKAEIEGEMGDPHMGLQARLMSQALRKLTGNIALQHAGHLHQPDPHEDRRHVRQPGDHDRRQRAQVLRLGAHRHPPHRRASKRATTSIGDRTRVKVVKNKVAPPFKEAEFDILYGKGISREGEIVDLGSELGVIEKSGAWYSYGGERIGQGREAAKSFLKEHPETANDIMAKVMEKIGIQRRPAESPAAATVPSADKKEKGKVR